MAQKYKNEVLTKHHLKKQSKFPNLYNNFQFFKTYNATRGTVSGKKITGLKLELGGRKLKNLFKSFLNDSYLF